MKLFVGIDPGTTVGIAVLDAQSKTRLVETHSERNFSYFDIVKRISERGEPVVVATDKAKPPAIVRRIAACFGARLYFPRRDMGLAEKTSLTKGFSIGDDHEADALAAVLAAKDLYSDTLRKVEQGVEASRQGIVKKLVICGAAANIETAIEMLEVRRAYRGKKDRQRTKSAKEGRLEIELESARLRNASLESEIARLGRSLDRKQSARDESEAVASLRKGMISLLKAKEKTIRDLERVAEGTLLAVINYDRGKDMRGRAVLLNDVDEGAVREIERSGAEAIVTDLDIPSALPRVSRKNANIRRAGKFLVMERPPEQAEDFEAWLDAYKEKRKEQS